MKKIWTFLVVVLFSLLVSLGCAHAPKQVAATSDTYDFTFNDQPNFAFHIPNSVPDITKLTGFSVTTYSSDESKGERPFKLIAFIGKTKDEKHNVGLLHAFEGPLVKGGVAGKDFHCYIIAISHISESGKELWIDKSYFEKGIATGRYIKCDDENWPSLDGIIKMKTGRIKWEI